MKRVKNSKTDAPHLRRQAEERLSVERPAESFPDNEADRERLWHELQVHQIELQMQNEELQRTLLEIEEAKDKYSDLYDFAPVGYLTLTNEGIISELNLTTSTLLGTERRYLIKRPLHHFIKSESKNTFHLHLKDVLASSTAQTCDLMIKKHDDSFFPVRLSSIKVDTEGQRMIRSVLTDIASLVAAEEALRQSERREYERAEELTIMLEAVPTPVVIVHNPDATHMTGNRAADELLRQPSGAEVSLSAPPDVRPRHFRAMKDGRELRLDELPAQRAAMGEHVRDFEFSLVFDDGTTRHVLGYGTPLLDSQGHPRGAVHVLVDITDRKQAEEEVRKARDELELRVQKRTAQLQDSERIALHQMREIETYYHMAPIGLCVLDTDLRYLRINELLAGWNGLPASEHLGRTLHEVVPWLADEAEGVARQVIETGNPVINMEITGETPDQPGIRRTWMADWYPVKDSTGSVVNISVVAKEITQERKLEDRLRQSQKLEAIGTLAGGIAHDFNNMLAAILGFTEMALEDIPDRPDVQRSLRNVSRAAMRGRDLVKQILAFSRKTGHERNPLSLLPLIKETVQLLRASIPSTIEIKFIATATSDMVLAAPIEMQQILMNLATNASLAMQEKGGTMEIRLTDIDIGLDSLVFGADISPGEYVQLVVKDTGTGMGPDVIKRVFEPFFTTREVGKGTGMGLAVVYGIVKDLQGTITVESEPGAGSTFSVLLPKVKTDAQAEVVQPVEISGGNERVLFVDDEEMLVEWGRATLERLGYKVTVMMESREALKIFLIDPSRFDLVITDHAMPQMAGSQLAKELLTIRGDIPIILCTGHSDNISPESVREIGVKEFLSKPVSKQELAAAVRRVLDGKDGE